MAALLGVAFLDADQRPIVVNAPPYAGEIAARLAAALASHPPETNELPPTAVVSVRAIPKRYTKASAVSAGAGPYLSGAIVKLARPWLTLRTAAE